MNFQLVVKIDGEETVIDADKFHITVFIQDHGQMETACYLHGACINNKLIMFVQDANTVTIFRLLTKK